jgi:hypothetical protein
MRILPLPAAVALLALTAACSSPFKRIYPGMTEAQVSAVMEQAPSRTDLFEEDYAAWYYGEDHCLLLHEGVVVAKQQTEETAAVSTPVGTLREELRAQCLPPGVARPEQRKREIDIHLPDGRLHHPPGPPPKH